MSPTLIVPMELPGATVPPLATATLPSVPVPPSVPPSSTLATTESLSALTDTSPPSIDRSPVKAQ